MLREAFRLLRPGGRFAVSDVVTRGEIQPEIRESVLLWIGCVAGALEEGAYLTKLAEAGFGQISVGRRGYIAPPTRANFSPLRESMRTRLHLKLMGSS